MRQSRLIVIAAVTAIFVAWLLLTQLPRPAVSTARKAAASASAAAAPEPAHPAVATDQPAAATPAAAPAQAASTAEPKPVQPESAAAKPEEPPKNEDTAPQNESEEAARDESAEEPETADESAHPAGLDVNRAADLLADWMARQDTAASEDADIPKTVQALRTFDQEASDAQWSDSATQQVQDSLNAWLDALPDDVRDDVGLIHVECRQTLCQILAADADMAGQNERAQSSQEWQQAITMLPQQPWWSELGFADLVTAVDNDSASGYVLYQTYLRREVKPPQ